MALSLLLTGCDLWTTPDTRVERARGHLQQASYRNAMTELKGALASDPNHSEARAMLAELSLWLGELDDADKEIERATQAGAPAERVRELRYRVLLERGDLEKLAEALQEDQGIEPARRLAYEARIDAAAGNAAAATEKVTRGLELAPKDPELLFERAHLQVVAGDATAALALPETLAGNDLWQARALQLRGTVLLTQGKHKEAGDSFAQGLQIGNKALPVREQLVLATALTEVHLALNALPQAEESLLVLTRWAPKSLMAHYFRARIAMAKGDGATAVAEAQRALAISVDHVPSQLLLGAAHLTQKSYEQAESVLEGVIAAHPQNTAARKLLAQVQLGRNRPDLAQQALAPAGQLGENDAQMAWLMGVALLQSGSSADGIAYLERGYAGLPGDTSRALDLATAYLARGAADKALPLLKGIPASSPVYPRAQALLVLATTFGKSRTEAAREVDALVAAHPQDAGLLTAAGSFLARLIDQRRGRELLERAVRLDPKNVLAYSSLARVAATSGDVLGARAALGEILKIDPAHEGAHIALSELAWRAGDRATARKQLEAAVAAAPQSVEARTRLAQIAFIDGEAARGKDLLDQAVQVATERSVALLNAGRVLGAAGFTDEALARLQQASAAGLDDALLSAAQVQLGAGRIAEARQLVQTALDRKPGWSEAQGLLVTIDVRDGQLDRALARARQMPRPAGMSVAEVDGDIHAMAGKKDEAIRLYETAQRATPTAALAIKIYNVRRTLQGPGAERSLTEWLERKPADSNVRRTLAQHYESVGRVDDAVAQYERLAKEQRLDPAVLNNLAWLLAQRNDPRALDIARRAYEAAPGVAEVADTYGWILVRSDKVAEGLPVLERALAAAPMNPDVQFHAAAAYAKSGKNARAVELLRQCLQPGREFAARAEAEELLRSLDAKES